jgi:hypothetical protein
MNSFGTTLRILGLIVCGALALFYTGVVLLAVLALATAGGSGGQRYRPLARRAVRRPGLHRGLRAALARSAGEVSLPSA